MIYRCIRDYIVEIRVLSLLFAISCFDDGIVKNKLLYTNKKWGCVDLLLRHFRDGNICVLSSAAQILITLYTPFQLQSLLLNASDQVKILPLPFSRWAEMMCGGKLGLTEAVGSFRCSATLFFVRRFSSGRNTKLPCR